MGALHEDRYTFLIVSSSLLARMKNISDKSCRENRNTCFMILFFLNSAVCEIMWNNIVERGRPQMTKWRLRIACWIITATNTHSVYVMFIDFLLQQWLSDGASILRHTYISCLVKLYARLHEQNGERLMGITMQTANAMSTIYDVL